MLDDDGANEPEKIVDEGCSTNAVKTTLPDPRREFQYDKFERLLSTKDDIAYELTFTCDVNVCEKSKKTLF